MSNTALGMMVSMSFLTVRTSSQQLCRLRQDHPTLHFCTLLHTFYPPPRAQMALDSPFDVIFTLWPRGRMCRQNPRIAPA